MNSRRWKIAFVLISTVVSVFGYQNCGKAFITSSESPESLQSTAANMDNIGSPCPEVEYRQFLCLNKNLTSQEGLIYNVNFRWNRVHKESQGTIVWVLGGDGRGKWRTDFKESAVIQDDFDTANSIRSVEVEFLDAPTNVDVSGGYWKYPRGYYSAASAYMAALQFVSTYLKKGKVRAGPHIIV